jgi:hypothetical protein
MNTVLINEQGDLQISASPTSSQNDFDFFTGKWKVHNRKLKIRLGNCNEWHEFEAESEMRKILQGMGNTDNFISNVGGKTFEGMTLRLFNPATRLWSIYWADSNTGVLDTPVVGSFQENTGTFYTRDFWEGIPIIMKFKWDRTHADKPEWSQAFSIDNGQNWEWNWYMYFSRKSF